MALQSHRAIDSDEGVEGPSGAKQLLAARW